MRRVSLVVALVLVVAGLVGGRGAPLAHADVLPSITIGSASVIEGDSGSAVVNVPVDLSAPPTVKTTVQYWIHSTTATAGTDFVGTAGLLTFIVGGPVSKFISVTVYGDLLKEPDETVLVDLSMEKNATLANSEGTVTILDDDSDTNVGLQASVGDFSVEAAPSGTHYAELPVTLSRPAPSTVKVNYTITCSDAVDGGDYVFQNSGSVTFNAGDQSKQLKFQILPNETDDEVKTILGSITVSTGPASVDDNSSAATIVDGTGDSGLPPMPVGGIERESVNSDGAPAEPPDPSVCSGGSQGSHAGTISADGRYVAFTSDATNLVPNDSNGQVDAFVRDRVTGTVERVSVASDGSETAANGGWAGAYWPTISRDGRYVTFWDYWSLGGYPGQEYFIHDRQTGTTVPLFLDLSGNPAQSVAWGDMILSSDDRYVAFTSCDDSSGVLVPSDPDPSQPINVCDVFRLDRTTGVYTLVSNPPDGSPSDGGGGVMSADGRYVAFVSSNTNYVPGDTNTCPDLFVRDMETGTFERVNVTTGGDQALPDVDQTNGNCGVSGVSMSDDGRYVAFTSTAWNLIGLPDASIESTYSGNHLFVRDRVAGTTTRVDPPGVVFGPLEEDIGYPSLSADGAYVAYSCNYCSEAGDVVTNLATGETVRVSELPDGTLGDEGPGGKGDDGFSSQQAFSADGSYLVYSSYSDNLVNNDTNNTADVFVKRIH
jgi:hypothetical protein